MKPTLTDKQRATLQKAEDLLSEAAGLINNVISDLEDASSDAVPMNMIDAYEDAYGAMCKLSEFRV